MSDYGDRKEANWGRIQGVVLLIASVAFILYATVLFCTPGDVKPQLELFWSYKAWFAGNKELGKEIIESILLFIPFGFALGLLT